MKVLVVDDDLDLVDLMTYAMRREGYAVVAATDGRQALQRWEAERPDIVVLDVNLPGLDGFEVCRRIRQDGDTPIVMLTARDEDDEIVRGLRLGADDYVTKPFSAKQLAARMQAVIRRCEPDPYRRPVTQLQAGDLAIDLDSHTVTCGGRQVQLTPLEFRILHLLAMNEGRVIPHGRLVDYVWGYEDGRAGLLKTHICHLRRKLGLPSDGPGSIRAISGVGYTLARA